MTDSPEQRLHALMNDVVVGKLAPGEFALRFDRLYSVDLDQTALAPDARDDLGELFKVVVWFSALPESARSAGSTDPDDLLRAVRKARHRLRLDIPEERLEWLMNDLVSGREEVEDFARKFEALFTFELDKSALSPIVLGPLRRVFEVVARFSPSPEERARIPQYRGPDDVREAVRQCRRDLSREVERAGQ